MAALSPREPIESTFPSPFIVPLCRICNLVLPILRCLILSVEYLLNSNKREKWRRAVAEMKTQCFEIGHPSSYLMYSSSGGKCSRPYFLCVMPEKVAVVHFETGCVSGASVNACKTIQLFD